MSRTKRVNGYAWFKSLSRLNNKLDIQSRLSWYRVRLEDAFEPVIHEWECDGETRSCSLNQFWCNFRIGSERYVATDYDSWIRLTHRQFKHENDRYQRDGGQKRGNTHRLKKEFARNIGRREKRELLYRLTKDHESDYRTTPARVIRGIVEWVYD